MRTMDESSLLTVTGIGAAKLRITWSEGFLQDVNTSECAYTFVEEIATTVETQQKDSSVETEPANTTSTNAYASPATTYYGGIRPGQEGISSTSARVTTSVSSMTSASSQALLSVYSSGSRAESTTNVRFPEETTASLPRTMALGSSPLPQLIGSSESRVKSTSASEHTHQTAQMTTPSDAGVTPAPDGMVTPASDGMATDNLTYAAAADAVQRTLGPGFARSIASGPPKFPDPANGGNFSWGGAQIRVPPGAWPFNFSATQLNPLRISIVQLDPAGAGYNSTVRGGPASLRLVGLAAYFQPSGACFPVPVEIALPFDPAQALPLAAGQRLVVCVYDPVGGSWVSKPSRRGDEGRIDAANGLVYADTDTFSLYAPFQVQAQSEVTVGGGGPIGLLPGQIALAVSVSTAGAFLVLFVFWYTMREKACQTAAARRFAKDGMFRGPEKATAAALRPQTYETRRSATAISSLQATAASSTGTYAGAQAPRETLTVTSPMLMEPSGLSQAMPFGGSQTAGPGEAFEPPAFSSVPSTASATAARKFPDELLRQMGNEPKPPLVSGAGYGIWSFNFLPFWYLLVKQCLMLIVVRRAYIRNNIRRWVNDYS